MQYISNTEEDKKNILKTIGVNRFEELISMIPSELKSFKWNLPIGISEIELVQELREAAHLNRHTGKDPCYLGGGVYDHFVPHLVNHLALRGEFITSYTPYQGEASQGTLQSIYEFQSLICELTGMDFSNASMYDGASAFAEAGLMAIRANNRKKILVAGSVHPEYIDTLRTYLSFIEAEVIVVPFKNGETDIEALKKVLNSEISCVMLQQPNFFGALEDVYKISEMTHQAGALFITAVNPLSLGVIAAPGEYGADIAVGEGQPLGNGLSYGGPHFGFFTVKADLLRKMPGRIAGMTVDTVGRRSFVLTLQAREQHIRREKATSNICTNHALCALKATIYLSLLGQKGLEKIALLNLEKAREAYEALIQIKGVKPLFEKPFFNEFALTIDKKPEALRQSFEKNRIIGPLHLESFFPEFKNAYLVAVTEKRSANDLKRLVEAIEKA